MVPIWLQTSRLDDYCVCLSFQNSGKIAAVSTSYPHSHTQMFEHSSKQGMLAGDYETESKASQVLSLQGTFSITQKEDMTQSVGQNNYAIHLNLQTCSKAILNSLRTCFCLHRWHTLQTDSAKLCTAEPA